VVHVICVSELCKLLNQPPFFQNDRVPKDRNNPIGKDIPSCNQARASCSLCFYHDTVGVISGVAACVGTWAQFTLMLSLKADTRWIGVGVI